MTQVEKRILDHVVTNLPTQADLTQQQKDEALIRALQEAANQGLTLKQDDKHSYHFEQKDTKRNA